MAGAAFLAGCSACGNGDGCALLAIEAAAPVIMPVAVVVHVAYLAKAPFDPVYAALVGPHGAIDAAWRYELPFGAQAVQVADDGAMTGFSSVAGGAYTICAAGLACSPAAPVMEPPSLPVGCFAVSSNGAFCLVTTRQDRHLVALPARTVLASLPQTRHEFGTFNTVSNRGELFSPSEGGYDRTDAAGVRHVAVAGHAIAAARLGGTDRLLQITGDKAATAWPPVLHLLAAPDGPERATAALPADVWLLMGIALSPDGAWCAVTYAPAGGNQRILLFHLTGRDITLAGTIVAPSGQMKMAFAPGSGFLAVINSGAHDRRWNLRGSVFWLQ